MPLQVYYFLAIIAIFAAFALLMRSSVKKYNAKMASIRSKKPRRR